MLIQPGGHARERVAARGAAGSQEAECAPPTHTWTALTLRSRQQRSPDPPLTSVAREQVHGAACAPHKEKEGTAGEGATARLGAPAMSTSRGPRGGRARHGRALLPPPPTSLTGESQSVSWNSDPGPRHRSGPRHRTLPRRRPPGPPLIVNPEFRSPFRQEVPCTGLGGAVGPGPAAWSEDGREHGAECSTAWGAPASCSVPPTLLLFPLTHFCELKK